MRQHYHDFLLDSHKVGNGLVVGKGDWQARLESNKSEYALEYVRRADFLARYTAQTGAEAFVNLLDANACGVLLSSDEYHRWFGQ